MNLIRAAFLIITVALVTGTAYVGYFGAGGVSTDLDQSVRSASGGRVIGVAGRIK